MIYILNKKEEIMDILEPLKERKYYDDFHVQDLKEGSETLQFTANVNIPENSTIVLKTPSGELHPFIVQQIKQISNNYRSKIYYCDAEFLELRYTRIIEPVLLSGQTVNAALQYGIQGTRWTMGMVESETVIDIDITEHMTLLKYIRMLADVFDLEMRFRVEFNSNTIAARYIDLVKRAGIDMGKEIVFGKDLQSIERIEDTSSIVTALFAVGQADDQGHFMSIESVNNGKKYVADHNALQRWSKDGEHRFDIFTPSVNTNDLTPQLLFELTKKELAKRINSVVQYSVNSLDLYDVLGMEHERVFLGDTVRIKDEGFTPPLYVEARVIKIERSYTNPSQNKFTLGDYREIDIKTYRYIRDIQALLNSKKESWNKAEENALSRAQLIIEQTESSWSTTVTSLSEDLEGQISSLSTSLSVMDGKIASKVEKSNYNGESIVSLIEQTAEEIKISASKINLVGAVSVLSDITGNLGSITAGTITGATIESSKTGNSVVISDDTLKSYANRQANGSPLWGTQHLTIDSGALTIGASGSYDNIQLGAGTIHFGNIGTISADNTLSFVGTLDFSDATVSDMTVSNANYATSAGYASSAGSVSGSNVSGYVANASYASVAGKANAVGSQNLTLSVLSNGSLQVTTSSGKTATYLPDGWTG